MIWPSTCNNDRCRSHDSVVHRAVVGRLFSLMARTKPPNQRKPARHVRFSVICRSPSNYQRQHVWGIEDIFRTTKSILDTRPIYHQTDEAIRGHVFCSFLALVLRKALEDSLAAARLKPEWGALLRELDRLQEIQTEQEGKHFILRTPVTGDVGRVFQAVGIALPPNIREAEAAAPIH